MCVCVSVCMRLSGTPHISGSEWEKGPSRVPLSDSEVFCQLLNDTNYTDLDSIATLIS